MIDVRALSPRRLEDQVPEDMCKTMRDVTKRRRSTVGTRSRAGRRIRQAIAPLDDPREDRFVEKYVETSNGTQSAIVAGYSVKSAHVYSTALLKKPRIKEAIAKRNAEMMDALGFTPDRIIRELAKIAGVNSADFVTIDDDGTPRIDFTGVTRRELAAIASVERSEKGVKYRTHDKIRALVELAKLARMYPAERTEVTGADGGPITAVTLNATQHKIDIEGMTLEERAQLKQTLLMLKAKRESET